MVRPVPCWFSGDLSVAMTCCCRVCRVPLVNQVLLVNPVIR